jgi:hypothetical protein
LLPASMPNQDVDALQSDPFMPTSIDDDEGAVEEIPPSPATEKKSAPQSARSKGQSNLLDF